MDELLKKIDDIGNEIANINELYLLEVKEKTTNSNFDPYSAKGKKLLNKIALKYADSLLEKEEELESIQKEIMKIEQQKRTGTLI
ncbi:MAG: hypothetical protein RR334_01450 [Clostridia bacterium]